MSWITSQRVLRTLFAVGAAVLVLVGVLAVRVYQITHPPRAQSSDLSLAGLVAPVETIDFQSTDGVPLKGWEIRTPHEDAPPVILCHDLGRDKASLLDLGLLLHKHGFTVFLFDFRGHGESGGQGSSLGLVEKRDVLGALDHVLGEGRKSVGLYGVGMGAYAALQAAADRPEVEVLVLDGLYPDVSFQLRRTVFHDWKAGGEYLGPLADGLYRLLYLNAGDSPEATQLLSSLGGRQFLLLAPAGDTRLVEAMKSLYLAIPEQRDREGNLVLLPTTRVATQYGIDRDLYEVRILKFLTKRL